MLPVNLTPGFAIPKSSQAATPLILNQPPSLEAFHAYNLNVIVPAAPETMLNPLKL